MNGQVLRSAVLNGQSHMEVGTWDLPGGFYLLTAQTAESQQTYKLVKR